jgi:arylsulfatase A-like enzyme
MKEMKWIVAGLLVAASVAVAKPFVGGASRSPNVILILADDLGYADLSCHGSEDIRTPNIDALAASGIRFTEGYVPASVCGASRACLMSGRYACEFGVRGNSDAAIGIPLDQKNIAEYLKQGSGVFTAVLGKWHLGEHSVDQTPIARGFDHFLGFLNGKSHYWPFSDAGQKQINTTEDFPTQRNEKILTPADYPPETYMTDLLTQEAVEIVQGGHGRGDQPFFIYLSYNAPHGPLQAPEDCKERNSHIKDKARNTFAGMMTSMDDGIGRVIQALKDEGLYENTMVIFLSDNGGPTTKNTSKNTPFRGVKGEVWEGGVRVPFMVSWPAKIKAGQVREEPVCSIDLAPTIVSLAGLKIDPSTDGIDLSAWLTDAQKELPSRDLYYWRAGNRAIRSGRYKYEQHGSEKELFDIKANPVEDPAQKLNAPERQSAMADKLARWEEPWPENISAYAEKQKKPAPEVKKEPVAEMPAGDALAEWTFGGSLEADSMVSGLTVSDLVFNPSFGSVDGFAMDAGLTLRRAAEKAGSSWGAKGGASVEEAPISFSVTSGAKGVTLTGLTVVHAGGPKMLFSVQEASAPTGSFATLGKATSPLFVPLSAPVTVSSGETKTFTIKLNSGRYGTVHQIKEISLNGWLK